MLNLSTLKECPEKTIVRPSSKIFNELGKNTYNYQDLLSELIDNSIAARIGENIVDINIAIYLNQDNETIRFIIRDNASGVPKDRLGDAIAPAGVLSKNSLNEHGLGMKQAIAALGELEYFATKTKGEEKARVIRKFAFGDLSTYYADFAQESGTEISVINLNPIIVKHPPTITKTVAPYLGARYRRFLNPEARRIQLTLSLFEIKDKQTLFDEHNVKLKQSWNIEAVQPVYFHPSSRKNKPVILRHPVSGSGWKAELTFGYAPQDKEYEELDLEPPNRFAPYTVSRSKQGLDIILHNRVILFHQLAQIGLVSGEHSDYNTIRGEIDLKEGFTTAITKNSIIHDQNFLECVDKIKRILEGKEPLKPKQEPRNYLRSKTYPDQIPEKLLRDRLSEWLKTNAIAARDVIEKEYSVGGLDGHIDILADKESWEIKTDKASALDVYQLFMYMDVGEFKTGFLVAKEFTPGAHFAIKHISEKHGMRIKLAKHSDFPITEPPTASEREEYY